jgi:hypothetical protein
MTASRSLIGALVALFAGAVFAAQTAAPGEKKLSPKDAVKARMLEDGKKKAANPAPTATPPTAPTTAKDESKANPLAPNLPKTAPGEISEPVPATTTAAAEVKPADQAPTIMPKVEVRKERITVLDVKIAEQEREIAREKQNTKPSEIDQALNDSKLAKKLSIFGGQSDQYRANIANERVSLMEAEKDILEAMKTARTKAEKAELQKQLDELRALRRDLEKSLK